MRYLLIMGLVLGLIIPSFESVYATPFTPLEWQPKHTSWVRDRNRNFIDDIIDKRLEKEDKFDIIVDLNTFLTVGDIGNKFKDYGQVKYVGKMITFIYLNNVEAKNLFKIAKMDVVAMIEIQQDFQPALDISARAVQAKDCEFCPNGWQSAAASGLTGSGINIAIIDTGVDDDHEQFTGIDTGVDDDHEQFTGKFIAGFDATIFEDTNSNGIDDSCEPAPWGNGNCNGVDDEPADGTTNPDDDWKGFGEGHGTHVAGIALGKGVPGRDCRNPNDEEGNCAGVAPGAGIVDIKVCYTKKHKNGGEWYESKCESMDMAEALDWLGLNFNKDNIKVRVANISLTYATGKDERGKIIWDDDGTSSIAQQVNYLSALGIVMVAAHGNAVPNYWPGTRVTHSPGSASFAVTVSGTDDKGTVTRGDDYMWDQHLVGPRSDFEQSHDILALKPDISAPAQVIKSAEYDTTDKYREMSGTSMAAPHVSGAAAIILEAKKEMNPGGLKDALKQSADNDQNTRAALLTALGMPLDWKWDKAFGWGMLNVRAAIALVAATDVGFPACSGPPNNSGSPCALSMGQPFWNNNQDISTSAPPQVGVENQIQAVIKNSGPNDATVLVNFGVYIFAVGNNQFFHIGTKQVEVPGNSTITVSQPWTPLSPDHQCIQVSIDYGLDTNFNNNVTQRNLQVAPSNFTMRVENPFPVPAEFVVRPSSKRVGWDCSVDRPKFTLHPYLDPPEIVQITFHAPIDAQPGERADCDVAVFARPKGEARLNVIGGVTVQTFVPKPCRIIGWIRDERENPVSGAKVILNTARKGIEAESDKYGFVSFEGIPYLPQKVTVISEKYGEQSTNKPVRLYCGAGTFEILVTEKGIIIKNNRRKKDWAWDSQVREGYEFKR
ncbi:MAG TPA: S8 family serine peptidase [Desulfobacteraceae bacterium]|nr:S8 family serine peptidase [Desulfobacteraceae bacterium]HPJ66979.1 S8 family serine peptidase [Desulfobacteraceae bacterium]HPQ27130.1 S8 family serine peptidase [Desulfobacteraceae bacterium]